jgi:hypothetical protein
MNLNNQDRKGEAVSSCRDRGWGGADAGTLCLSVSPSRTPWALAKRPTRLAEPDRHKAPTPALIRPLSLQKRDPYRFWLLNFIIERLLDCMSLVWYRSATVRPYTVGCCVLRGSINRVKLCSGLLEMRANGLALGDEAIY